MAMPLIDPLPPAPTPADPEPVFDDKAYETVAALAPFVEQANALAVAVEGQAERSKTEADRSQAQVSAATVEANRAKTEADRSKGEANRAQLAADNAVAVTTGGTASIDPAPGKIPIAGADAAIKQAWVKDLEFELDALRVARNKLMYGDGPYPVLDLQFQGAKRLDPRIRFTRASTDWDWEGSEYGINEPVLSVDGLRLSQRRENLLRNTNKSENWNLVGVSALIGGAILEGTYHIEGIQVNRIRLPQGTLARVSFSPLSPLDGSYVVSYRMKVVEGWKEGALTSSAFGASPFSISINLPPPGCFGLISRPLNLTQGGEINPVRRANSTDPDIVLELHGVQLNRGEQPKPYIPTADSVVTVEASRQSIPIDKEKKNRVFVFDFMLEGYSLGSGATTIFGLGDSDAGEGVSLVVYGGLARFSFYKLGHASVDSTSRTAMQEKKRYKVAVRVKEGGIELFINGEKIESSLFLNGTTNNFDSLTLLNYSSAHSTSSSGDVIFRSVAEFWGFLSDDNLIELTQ